MNFKITLLVLMVVLLIGIPLGRALHISVWEIFIIVLIGILINGWVATREDDRPGGFNNP